MKVAVASEDGTSVSRHFGRSACFIVYEIEGSRITGKEVRQNTYTSHAQGNCHGEESAHEHHHSHSPIVSALHDCEAVLCYGMGWRAAEDLTANNIKPVVMAQEHTPDEAVALLVAGELLAVDSGFCRCHE